MINDAVRSNLHRLGKPLHAPYAGQRVARRSSYRIRYRIDEDKHAVIVLDVRGRADAYHSSWAC
ncbi:MAG: type II toxin-antitoxin system RelE/ParE family toxin [Mycobacteriales bacterium]